METPMTTVYIVRHAWAGDRDEKAFPDDRLRPLTARGRKRFQKFVKRLEKRGFAPQLVATSPLLRCRQTADIIAGLVPGCGPPVERIELCPDGELAPLATWSATRQAGGAERIAWVGHAPDVGRMVARLIGGDGDIEFSKGAVAAVLFPGPIAVGHGVLRWLITPRMAGR
jgi:phosphohistidine phosphatase